VKVALQVNKFVIECICVKCLHLCATASRCFQDYIFLLLIIFFVQLYSIMYYFNYSIVCMFYKEILKALLPVLLLKIYCFKMFHHTRL